MADSSALPSSTPRSRVVRSLARAVERPCSRPGCPAPARATLTFVYAEAEVLLDRLADDVHPQGYDLCARHAARTEPPRGWHLTDRRPEDDRLDIEQPVAAVRDLGGQATVDVLAAALRAVPPPSAAPVDLDPSAAPVDLEPSAATADAREPATEHPRVPAPRRVPAAGDRGPATDW